MGTSNSCSNCNNNTEILVNRKKFMDAYGIFKSKAILFRNNGSFKIDAFLINLNTINKFMEIVKKSNVLDDLSNNNMENLNSLKILENNLSNYTPEKNIEIYYDYIKCKNIAENERENNNRFIIVDKTFLTKMDIQNYENKGVKVDVVANEIRNRRMKVIFNGNNENCICFKEITFGIFSFIKEESTESSIDEENKTNRGKTTSIIKFNSEVQNPINNPKNSNVTNNNNIIFIYQNNNSKEYI